MKKLVLIGLATFVLGLVPARPAEAQAVFIRWLEKLSGPGPFTGLGFELYGICYGVPKGDPRDTDPPTTAASRNWFVDINCGRASRGSADERGLNINRAAIGLHYSRMWGDNELQYDPAVPEDQTDRVTASLLMGIADFGLIRALDVGAGVGFIRFSGTPAPAFSKLTFEPIRVTFKPIALKRAGAYRHEALQLRVVMTVLPGGFDAEDFGALAGTFKSNTEIQGNLYLLLNLGSVFGV
jgi:hypothetical protein